MCIMKLLRFELKVWNVFPNTQQNVQSSYDSPLKDGSGYVTLVAEYERNNLH